MQTGSVLYPISNKIPEIKFAMKKDSHKPYDQETAVTFRDIMEIEEINRRTEQDMMVHNFQTEKRENVEKLMRELEFSEQFPELKQKVELERKYLLANVTLKDELKNSQFRVAPGSNIITELIEQSAVYNQLEKLRKELSEYAYKAKDASYLFKEDDSVVFKKEDSARKSRK